jgi:hypothetical protein
MVSHSSCTGCNSSSNNLGWIRAIGSCSFDCNTAGGGGCIETLCLGVVECTPWNLPCNEW